MNTPVHIFLSHSAADAHSAQDLQRQITTALQPHPTVFWSRADVPVEEFRAKASAFLEKTDLFVAVLSMNYEDSADVRWEMATALEMQRTRPGLQIMSVLARETRTPAALRPFQTALPSGETIENQGIPRDRQLRRAAETAVAMLAAAPVSNEIPIGKVSLPITIQDLRERLLAQTDRINHAPLLALLKRLIKDVLVKRVVLDTEEAYKQMREQTRLSQISIAELQQRAEPVQMDLNSLIERLEENQLVKDWRSIFIRDYYHFTSESRDDSTVPPFFVPVDEISIPETLNLPVGPREEESLEQIGLLSYEQKTDFRRSLLLAKDALAVKNAAQAYAHCDHARQKIDPQSAQLYEYLLITFIQKETPTRAMMDAVQGNDRVLQHILLFASRLREYQHAGKCPSSTAMHNLAIASESISDAALRLYYHFPNDPLRDTGKHAEEVPDNRRSLRIILGNTLKVCRLVHPSEELLEAAVIECCGGGKCHWMKRVDVVDGHFQFVPDGHIDLIGETQELLQMLQSIEDEDPNKIVKGRALLREDLYFSLLAKRQTLSTQLAEDAKRRRPYTDSRESIIRFTYACLFGAHIFGETDARGRGTSFLRLALEYLLPGLLRAPEEAEALSLRWFTLDANGQVAAHPDCAAYSFDVLGIVEKIVRDHAGTAGWMQVQPNIKETVYRQYIADTAELLDSVKARLAFTDVRRMNALDARRLLIDCLRRWVVAYKAEPARGLGFLENCVRELTGDGILLWLLHNPHTLVAHPESSALGYDAQMELKKIHDLLVQHPEGQDKGEAYLRERIAVNLFEKRIVPVYDTLAKGDESQREGVVWLMQEALSNYKLHPNLAYLDFVWKELSEEVKLPWVDISLEGKAIPYKRVTGFDPIDVLRELQQTHPFQYSQLDARERISARRHANQVNRYFKEISEFRHENRQPERKIAIEIIQKIKGIYLYFPKAEYLELAWDELYAKPGKYRIRWNSRVLGILPLSGEHYENEFFNFNYKFERFELKRLLDNQYEEMQRVLRETGH
jgi:TIR domain